MSTFFELKNLPQPPPDAELLGDAGAVAAADTEADAAGGALEALALPLALAVLEAAAFALPELACLEAFADVFGAELAALLADLAAVDWAFPFAFGAPGVLLR